MNELGCNIMTNTAKYKTWLNLRSLPPKKRMKLAHQWITKLLGIDQSSTQDNPIFHSISAAIVLFIWCTTALCSLIYPAQLAKLLNLTSWNSSPHHFLMNKAVHSKYQTFMCLSVSVVFVSINSSTELKLCCFPFLLKINYQNLGPCF